MQDLGPSGIKGGEFNLTAPATDAARQWDGWGTALKPAWEPVIVARKPLDGTVAANVLRHGTGALNIDGCRVQGAAGSGVWGGSNKGCQDGRMFNASPDGAEYRSQQHPFGRWPANVLHDGSDEVLTAFPGDEGRFFYCPKASTADRDEGLDALPEVAASGLPMRSAGGERGGEGLDGTSTDRLTKRRNTHPTVKNTELMRYLCRLITPPGGTVLDPFTGSGSTGKAIASDYYLPLYLREQSRTVVEG